MEYDLGRDGRRREESDQPEPLDPAIVDRRLSQVEQTVIPFDEPPHHGYEWHSVLSVLMLGGRVSTSDMQRGVALPCCGFGSGLANPELEAGPEEARDIIGLRLDSLPHGPGQPLEGLHLRQQALPLPLVRPRPRDASVGENHGGEPPRGAVHALVMAGVHEVALVLVAEEEPIEIREKTDRRS